jgi:hypothetical protein
MEIRPLALWHIFSQGRANKAIYMQKIFTLACAALIFVTSAFKPLSGLDDVINALRTGNATELSRYVDDNIEISLPVKSNSYSKAQAVMVLQDFFSNSGVKGFEVMHKGENAGGQFCIGTLKTRAGNYRTTFFMKTKNGRQLVKDIKFHSSN